MDGIQGKRLLFFVFVFKGWTEGNSLFFFSKHRKLAIPLGVAAPDTSPTKKIICNTFYITTLTLLHSDKRNVCPILRAIAKLWHLSDKLCIYSRLAFLKDVLNCKRALHFLCAKKIMLLSTIMLTVC